MPRNLIALSLALLAATPALAAPVFGVRTDLPGPVSPIQVAIADLDGDSAPDLVLTAPGTPPSQGLIATWFGVGDGYFVPGPGSITLRSPNRLVVGSLNGDAFPDLAVTGTSTSLSTTDDAVQALLGQGDGSFVSTATLSFSNNTDYTGVAIADLDGDGHSDIAASFNSRSNFTTPGLAKLFPGAGDGTFGDATTFGSTLEHTYAIAVGDVNNDGAPDIALATSLVPSAFLLRDPPDGWIPAEGPLHDAVVDEMALAQLDGDGMLDEVYSYNLVPYLLVRLSSQPTTPFQIPLAEVTTALVARDIDGDGFVDLLTTGDNPGRVEIRLGHGDGTFGTPASYAVGTRPRSIAVGDLNGDGLLDLAVANNGSASVTLLLQGHPIIGAAPGAPRFSFAAPFPNPARGAVRLAFQLASDEPCTIAVHDVRGRVIESRVLARPAPGPNSLRVLEGTRPAPGLYWATLRQGKQSTSRSFVVVP